MSQKLIEALLSLDTQNDDHWTQDGLPRLDVLKNAMGESVSRSDIAAVSKTFNRFNAAIEAEEGEADEQAEQETQPEAETEVKETTTEPPVVTDTEVEGEMSEAAKAEMELSEARVALTEAQKRFKAAQVKADKFRRAKANDQQKIPPHLAIKAFQRSQQAQRAKEVGTAEAFKKLTQGATPEEVAMMKQSLNDIL